MKKIFIAIFFYSMAHISTAQKPNVDSILQKVAVEKDEDKKVD